MSSVFVLNVCFSVGKALVDCVDERAHLSLLCLYVNLFVTKFSLMSQVIWTSTQENLILLYANNKGRDRPEHACSVISIFVIPSLESTLA